MTRYKSVGNNRVLVFSDIHGCFDEFEELLEKAKYNPSSGDVICMLGDFVDRGPKSAEVVRWFSKQTKSLGSSKVMAVYGNHEDRYIRYYRHLQKKKLNPNYNIPMRPLSKEKTEVLNSLSNEDLNYLSNLPAFIHFEDRNWVGVHAGFEPGKSLDFQDKGKVAFIRYLNSDNLKTVALNHDFMPPAGSTYWTDVYDLPYNVMYGHNVHSLTDPRVFINKHGKQLVGIDTGAPFGGHLTCFVLPSNSTESVTPDNFVQVKAKKIYSRSLLKTD